MSVAGTWNLSINSPMGKQAATLELAEHGEAVTGTATSGDDKTDLTGITRDGDRLTWSQKISKPFPMTVTFDLTFTGDSVAGTAKPGSFPASQVTGQRA